MDLNVKIRGNDKKKILKILIIVICINLLATVIVATFANVEILKTIILYLVSIGYVGYAIYLWKKTQKTNIMMKKESFENKYDPILTRFLLKNEFELDESLLNAEIYYLIRKGYIEIDKEKNVLRLKDRNKFKQIDALERINHNKIKEYSTDEIPSYESMFIGKILFAFHDEIELNELKRNKKQNYYYQRGEMCKLAMEKMLLYEVEKHGMLGNGNSINFISVVSILNIITSIILFAAIGRFNIILLLSIIINIALNVLIVKNENILSYKYSDEVIKYIDDLLEYVNILKAEQTAKTDKLINNGIVNNEINENNDKYEEMINDQDIDKELKFLFGIKSEEDLFI